MIYSPGSIILDLGQYLPIDKSLPIRWYGLLTGLGFLVALLLINERVKNKIGETQKQNLFDLLFWSFIGGIIGARLWFVILSFEYFSKYPQEIFFIWQGGQSIQGGFVGGILTGTIFYNLIRKEDRLPFWEIADLSALGLPFAQAIGRWGNFFNIEAFGKPTDFPWGLYVPEALRPKEYIGNSSFHPTFAYESIYLFIIGFFLWHISKKLTLAPGTLLFIYLSLYSLGRFFFEFLREDSLFIGPFPAAQVICVLTILISFAFIRSLNKRAETT